jgi:hypothetical protein
MKCKNGSSGIDLSYFDPHVNYIFCHDLTKATRDLRESLTFSIGDGQYEN